MKAQKDFTKEVSPILLQHGYRVKKTIGRGTYGSCFLVESYKYNKDFVIKVMELPDSEENRSVMATIESEIKALSSIIHPNIISIYDYFQTNDFMFLVLEYCEGGSLFDLIKDHNIPDHNVLVKLMRDVILALSFCHKSNIAHMDIKPSNILIDKFGNAKLADFGFAISECGQKPESVFKGSNPYMAPELQRRVPYNPFKADIWSLGVTIYEIFHGYLPWSVGSASSLKKQILLGCVDISPDIEPDIKMAIKACLQMDPNLRASPDDLLQIILPVEQNPIKLAPLKTSHSVPKQRPQAITYPVTQIIRKTKRSTAFPVRVANKTHLVSRIQKRPPHLI